MYIIQNKHISSNNIAGIVVGGWVSCFLLFCILNPVVWLMLHLKRVNHINSHSLFFSLCDAKKTKEK